MMHIPIPGETDRLHWFLLGLALGILLFFSCYRLTESPPIWFDEGFYTQIGMNIAADGAQRIQVAPHTFVTTSFISVGYPLLYPVGLSYRLFGVGVLQGRAVMVMFIVGLGLISYALVRRLHGRHAALLALFLYATFPMLYGNGKTVIGEVPGLFFLAACLWALVRLERDAYRNPRWYAAVGALAALCAATKPIYILFIAALFFTYLVRMRGIRLSLQGVSWGLLAFIAPLLLWVFLQFGTDVSLTTILSTYANPSNVPDVQALMLQNARRFITESTPIYTAGMLTLWGLALFIRRKKKIAAAELAAFLFSLLIVASYLRIEGWYRYLFPATVVALLFLPSALLTVFESVRNKFSFVAKFLWIPYLVLVMLGCAQLYQTAHTSFAAEYFESAKTRELAQNVAAISGDTRLFLYNVPELAIFLPSKNYFQYATLSRTQMIGAEELPALLNGQVDAVLIADNDFVAHPELFDRYTLSKKIDRYDLLVKK